jgi:ATP-dependent HslUV protease ATP-binding subunit HslU
MERLLEEISFTAGGSGAPTSLAVDAAYVDSKLKELSQNEDLSRYVL